MVMVIKRQINGKISRPDTGRLGVAVCLQGLEPQQLPERKESASASPAETAPLGKESLNIIWNTGRESKRALNL